MLPSDASQNSLFLGAHLSDTGCNFRLWAPNATRVELILVDEFFAQRTVDMSAGNNDIWQVHVCGITTQQRYGFRVHGPWNIAAGQRCNPAKLLIDPYARAITSGIDYGGPVSDHLYPHPADSIAAVPLSVVVADSAAPTQLPQRPQLADLVIYETHVSGYTKSHPAVPEHLRGTYAGLAHPAVIDHLLSLGINAIELLPVHHFISEPFITHRGMTNFWGYNSLGFFAPHARYCSNGTLGDQVREFKDMVSTFHRAGIAVILDVVYNHTCEGGDAGPTVSWRGIDNPSYYRLNSEMDSYDVTGCGNSLDTSNSAVLQMILDSLRYWATDMGIDGFRFDLATTLIRDDQHQVDQQHPFKHAIATDPVLSDRIMIAEPWDIGPDGYQVGAWGPGWSEWNDRFRDFVRDFWRGHVGGVQELATRLVGSADLFLPHERTPASSINFVTAHDGFTLRDLVTYDHKHNQANGEDNRDGSNDNRSWNCGIEGETTDPYVAELRRRQIANLMATLLLAHGVPMLTAGDELGRTQLGNNNAYCQDSPLSWVNWVDSCHWNELQQLTATLIQLRNGHTVLRPTKWLSCTPVVTHQGDGLERLELAWFHEHGDLMGDPEWNDPNRRSLGMYRCDDTEAFLVFFHAGDTPLELVLPSQIWGQNWSLVCNTADLEHEAQHKFYCGDRLQLSERSVAIFHTTFSDDK
ncbi:MAG: glycogen debranching protein GlgX [Propionibacteriaceae bacterium]